MQMLFDSRELEKKKQTNKELAVNFNLIGKNTVIMVSSKALNYCGIEK